MEVIFLSSASVQANMAICSSIPRIIKFTNMFADLKSQYVANMLLTGSSLICSPISSILQIVHQYVRRSEKSICCQYVAHR